MFTYYQCTMLRQQYQEKFINKKKIKNINDEIKEIFYLFEDLEEEVKKSQIKIDTIEDNIEEITEEVNETEEEVDKSKQETNKNYNISLYMILGGGLGSFIIAYNPYIGLGGIVGGMFVGSVIGYFK